MVSEESALQELNAEARAAWLEKHIVLVGFMGAGKTTLATLLAERLGRESYDSDQLIVRTSGRKIMDFFQAGQEQEFRDLEEAVVRELLLAPPAVIALGGGTLDRPELRSVVFAQSLVVNLAVSWREVQENLPKLRRTRPMLRNRTEAEIHELFLRRQHTYRMAPIRIQTSRDNFHGAVDYLAMVLTQESV